MEEIRLNRWLSMKGLASRRQADAFIREGKVLVNGTVATLGTKVTGEEKIEVNGRVTEGTTLPPPVLLLYNKPRGIVCTTSRRDKNNIIDAIRYKERIVPVGRLDKDSEGLLLLTNQGELMNEILRSRNGHEKEYEVSVDKTLTPAMLETLRGEFEMDGRIAKAALVEQTGPCTLRMILTQGINRQIRRMCEGAGLRVMKLRRVRIMNLRLGELRTGSYRPITKDERAELLRRIESHKQYS